VSKLKDDLLNFSGFVAIALKKRPQKGGIDKKCLE
jgi:hypothetical protein